MSVVGADDDGLAALLTALAQAAADLEADRRVIASAEAVGADAGNALRTVAELERWCQERHDAIGVRLALLRWYQTPWSSWLDGVGLGPRTGDRPATG